MAKVLVEPALEVEDIELEYDEEFDSPDNQMFRLGYRFPLFKFNDYLLKPDEIDSFVLSEGINTLPTYTISVNDSKYKIRESLTKDIDLSTIFVGYNTWYIKFKGILTNVRSSNPDSPYLHLEGRLFIPKLYEIEQYIYTDMTVQDILTDVCTKVGIGLCVVDCPDLGRVVHKCINPGMQFMSFLSFVITNFTNCIYSIDCYGFLYVGTIDAFKGEEVGKYAHKKANMGEGEETDIILSNKYQWEDKEYPKDEDNDLNISDYTHSSNYSEKHLSSALTYNVTDTKEVQTLDTSPELGTGDTFYNIFEGFRDTINSSINPFHNSITNKSLSGNLTKVTLVEPTFELTPFMMVTLNCYVMPASRGKYEENIIHLDEEHSGKRMVVKFSYKYVFQNNNPTNKMKIVQYIDLL
jgi:hypothetical protein